MRTIVPTLKTSPIFGDIFGDFDSFFNTRPIESQFSLHCDISESPTEIALVFDVPGLKKEDLNIEFEDSVLKISGERQRNEASDDHRKYRERRFGSFSRSFRIPETVLTEDIQAVHEDGVLTVTLPKKEKVKPKKISIRALGSKA